MKTLAKMKYQSWFKGSLLALVLLFLSSCEEDSYSRYGFDSEFNRNSSGLTMMSIGNNVASIRLNGSIFIDTGEMKVEFIDSDGFIVYSRNFFAPGNYFVNETFKASHGMWKLRYTSLEGTGSIDLHANYRP
jgi:hypothetical protein